MVARAFDLDPEGPSPFRDVRDGDPHAAAITALAESGIALGDTDGRYHPGEPVRRGQLASLLARAYALPPSAGGTFRDVSSDHAHAAGIAAAAAAGITEGFEDGTFAPAERVSREQTASFLVRAESRR